MLIPHSMIASIILEITYGIDVKEENDQYVTVAQEAMDSLAQVRVSLCILTLSNIPTS